MKFHKVVVRFINVIPTDLQGNYSYHSLSLGLRIGGAKDKLGAMDKKKRKIGTPVWRPVCAQASSLEGMFYL